MTTKHKYNTDRKNDQHTRLGQHFLTRPETAAKIADAAHLTKNDTVLEIGPGKGILTTELLKRAGKVVAIEKDPALIAELEKTYRDVITSDRLSLVQQDIRDFDPATCDLLLTPHRLVANIPYYITGYIIRKFLTSPIQPTTIVLLIQKEVAERIVARDGKESLLSLSVQAFGTPGIAHIVKAGAFSPPPKVDSAVLTIKHITRNNFTNTTHERRFFTTVHTAFGEKRKQVGGTLKTLYDTEALNSAGIAPNARPEDVSLQQWLILTRSECKTQNSNI